MKKENSCESSKVELKIANNESIVNRWRQDICGLRSWLSIKKFNVGHRDKTIKLAINSM